MEKNRSKKTFGDYFRIVIMSVAIAIVGFIVIIAILSRATSKDLIYFTVVGIIIGLICYIAKIKSK